MKKELLLGLCAVCMYPALMAQNPVRDLQADVEYNRYVNLTWEAPVVEQRANAAEGSLSLWKKVDFSTDYMGCEIIQLEDKYLVAPWENKKDTVHFQTLSLDMNVIDNYEIPAVRFGTFGASMILDVDDYIYARNGYRDSIARFDLKKGISENLFSPETSVDGLTYASDLNNGNGALVEIGLTSYSPITYGTFYYDKVGNSLDGAQLNFSPLSSDENSRLRISGIAYHSNKYYVVGTNGQMDSNNNEICFIWEFDIDGNYISEKGRITNYLENYVLRNVFTVNDEKTGNTYLVIGAVQMNGSGQYFYTLLYFELSKGGSVTGYDVFRNGEEITDDSFFENSYKDTLMEAGEYEYKVRAVYGDVVSDFETVNVTIKKVGECKAPEMLRSTIVNKGNVVLEWNRPVMEDASVLRYHIYRGEEYLGESVMPVFVDTVQAGKYNYAVTAEYDNSGVSEKAELSVEVSGMMDRLAPRAFNAVSYIDENAEAAVKLDWEEPLSGYGLSLGYSDMVASSLESDNVVYGMAVKYDKDLLNGLTGYAIDSVSFIAGCPGKYKIVIYENDWSVCQQWIDSLSVNYGALNTVALNSPVNIDVNKQYLVGIICKPDADAFAEGQKCVTYDDAVSIDARGAVSAVMMHPDDATAEYRYSNFKYTGYEKGHYNVKAHFSALNSDAIYQEGSGFEGYAVYRNGEKLEGGIDKETRSFTDKGMVDGDYTYTVASVWSEGEDVQSVAVTRNVKTLYGAPDNLSAAVEGSEITLNWNAPLNGAPVVKRWDSGENAGKLGDKNGGTLYAATMFTVDDLKSFGDFSVTSVEFFPAEEATFTVVIYCGDELVYSQPVNKENLKVGEFNVVPLLQPVAIDGTKDLRVGYRVEYLYNGRPCGLDKSESPDGKGNQLSMDGKTWSSASEQGIPNNWNIAFTVQYFNNTEVARIAPFAPASIEAVDAASLPATLSLSAEMTSSVQRSNLSGNTLAGYNVYRNGEKITASPVQDLTFSEVIAEGGDFEYYVGAVYTESEEMFSNRVSVSKTGVADVVSSAVAVYPNPATTEVHVSCGFDSYVVYDLSGRAVLRSDASGDVIGVCNLSAGQYLLVFVKDNMEYNRKITVVR